MSRSVTFNGITRFRPGAIARVNAAALNQIGNIVPGIMGIIGEADGGAPGSASGLVTVSDPAKAVDLFRSGPIVDAINLAFQSSNDPLVPGGASSVYVYKTNASTQASVNIPGLDLPAVSSTASGAGTTTTSPVTATLVASAHVGRWVKLRVAAMAGSPSFLRLITSNTTSQITFTPALPQAQAGTDTITIYSNVMQLKSRDYGAHTNAIQTNIDSIPATNTYQVITSFQGTTQTSPALGGTTRNYLHVVYRGGSQDIAADAVVVSGSTTSVVNVTPASLVAAAHANKTAVFKDASGNVKAITKLTTNGTGSVTLATPLSALPVAGDTVDILGVTNAIAGFTGASGLATAFTSTITGVTGDNLNIAITSSMTLNQLATIINGNPNYIATVPSWVNGDTTLASQFDWVSAISLNIQTSYSGTTSTNGFRQNVQEVINWVNNSSSTLVATRSTADVTDGSSLSTTDFPGATADPLPWLFTLTGGSRGISSNTDFQSGFDQMILRSVDEVVPLIDQDLTNEGNGSTATWTSVQAQLVSHVTTARGLAGMDRGGWIGYRGTKTTLLSSGATANDPDVQIVGQQPTVLDAYGNLVVKGPRELAVMGASMRLGVTEIGEPLTNKYLRASAITQDASWNPSSNTDAVDLINGGIMFAESIPGKGIRWVRDLTTWIKDDNLAYAEGSIRDVVRYVVKGLRDLLQDRFTGRKATPATIASIKDAVASLLESYRSNSIIVDSTDPATGKTMHAWHSLKVTSSGDTVRVNVGIFPVPGINFELVDLYLSLAQQSV